MSNIKEKATPGQCNAKEKYKVINWSEYNKSLRSRGSITVWVDEKLEESWYDKRPAQPGGQYKYSDNCILILYQLRAVYGLRFRQLEGFTASLLELMGLNLRLPCYTQICRRGKGLKVDLAAPKRQGGLYLVIDSTGLKVYGEGEWKVRKHGYSKRRTWRKLHLGVDESTGMIHAQVLTGNEKDDASQFKSLVKQVHGKVEKVAADGAYDRAHCWDLLMQEKIAGIIPPRIDAAYWEDEQGALLIHQRNKNLVYIDLYGRKGWKELTNYHRRSLSETAMFRYKTIFGAEMSARSEAGQQTEARIKARCLNKMTELGMPKSIKVA